MIMKDIKKSLRLRKSIKQKKPGFRRQEWFRSASLAPVWRKPRGIDSKLRAGEKARGSMPNIGYRSPKDSRGLDPKGLIEVRIMNPRDLKKLNPHLNIAVIGSTVGRKKRLDILKEAEKSGIKISNFKV